MGWTYNTLNPQAPTMGPKLTGIAVTLTSLSLVTVCLRLHVRGRLIKATGVDDWIIVICSAGFAIVSIIQTKWGLGLENINDLPQGNQYNFGLLQYIGAPFYITSILGFKLALLFSYLRFIPKGNYRKATVAVIVVCTLFHISFLFVQLLLCQPVAKQWDGSITEGSCLDGVPFYTSMASITIVFDVTVMLLPFPLLLKSQIQNRKKFVLLGLFGLGIFITVIQIIRIQTVKQLVNAFDSSDLILWSTVENNLGIIVASIPTLAPLVHYFDELSRHGVSSGRTTAAHRGTGYYGGSTLRGDVGSRYAMQTWKTRGVHPLDSGNDLSPSASVDGGKRNSTELIVDRGPPGGGGITKVTEVTVTRE
ncbi:hypothetical protein B0H66DRAFT_121536 [Apodospora peruviana]|uniref:Rhodopsin domain-containing protein n=1 Tax=Apodospora peruviana TaxID=516989 RepID=A0AAE0IIJ2_9PEZI|nr:hypothetical protein B0H66DRAFT_121536 [Apodospora peruviana]